MSYIVLVDKASRVRRPRIRGRTQAPHETDGWMSKAFTAYGVRAVPKAFLIDTAGLLRSEGTLADIAKVAGELLQ